MRIGIDMDGVLCDFNRSLIDFIQTTLNPAIPNASDTFPAEWHYFRPYVKPSEEAFLWEQVQSCSREFWRNLHAIDGSLQPLYRLSRSVHELYFITTRGGKTAKRQSEAWLFEKARIAFPTVIIADSPEVKGKLCGALDLDFFVDDRPENCQCAASQAPRSRTFLLDRSWNRHCEVEGVTRIASFEEFVQTVEKGKYNG